MIKFLVSPWIIGDGPWALTICDELWCHHKYCHWTPHDIIIDHTCLSRYASITLYFGTVTNTTSTLNQSLIRDALFLNYNEHNFVIKQLKKTKVLKCLSFLIMVSRKTQKTQKIKCLPILKSQCLAHTMSRNHFNTHSLLSMYIYIWCYLFVWAFCNIILDILTTKWTQIKNVSAIKVLNQ